MAAETSGEKIGEIFVEINARTKKLEAEIKQLKGKVDKEAEQMGSSFSAKFTKMLALAGAGAVIYNFFKRAVNGAMEAEAAETALYTQLGYTSTALKNQAAELQKLTKFEDDTVTKAHSMLAAFTKNEDQIIQLTKATTDFAQAKGMDLVSAAELVGKSFGAETNMLSRYGIEVKGAAGSTQRLNEITKGLSDLYGGQAEAAGKTFSGRLEQLKNRVGNLEESIGAALIPTLEKLGYALTDMVEEGEQASSFMQGVAVAGRIIGSVFIVVKTTLVHIGSLLGTIGAALYALASGQFAIIPGIIANGFNKITNNAESMISNIKEMWTGLDDVVKKSTDSGINHRVKSLRGLTDEEKKKIEEAKKLRLDMEADTYESMKFLATDYITWKSQKIAEEVEARRKAGVSEVLIEKYKITQMQKLFDDYSEWLLQREEEEAKKRISKANSFEEEQIERRKKFKGLISDKVEKEDNPIEDQNRRITDDLNEQKSAAQSWSSAISDGFMNIITKSETAAEAVKRLGIQFMGMILQAVLFKTIWAGITGGASLAIPGGHSGGNFIGTSSGVMKMARGGSFIVPPGFANDSFPLMVESGERVSVTPANQVRGSGGNNSDIVSAIARLDGSIKAMNRNLINKEFNANIFNPIDGTMLVKKVVAPNENKLTNAGVSLESL